MLYVHWNVKLFVAEIPVGYDDTVAFDLQSVGSYSPTYYQEKICEEELQVSNIA